ncbi:TPA: hypothetical protein NH846_006165 [Pseudomonas aeruginosa]|nr:hypothetical protein [Pseudomonas aeruginosa]
MTKANECTCPSGDGSLRHPCPAHPALVEQAGGDERAAFRPAQVISYRPGVGEVTIYVAGRVPGYMNIGDTVYVSDRAPVEQPIAALAQPSPVSEALIYACKNLAQITSSDGSGHADIALAVLRMAGVGDDERERLVNEWKAARAWKPSPAQAGANVGHGHVFPRADGVKMRCGGPGLCPECSADASRARTALAQHSPASDLDPLNLAPHAEAFNEAPAEALKPEPAEADRPEVVAWQYRVTAGPQTGWSLWHPGKGEEFERSYTVERRPLMTVAQHERIVGELRAVIAQLRQHKNDYMDSGQETYRALQNEIREREAEIARLDGLVSGRTAERDAALARVAELEHVLRVVVNAADHGSWPTTVMHGIEKVREVLAGSAPPIKAQPEETPGEMLAAKLIETWVAKHGKPAPWSKIVEITALATNMPNDERDRLLALDDDVDAQAQHSVSEEFIGRLSEFLAQRGATGKALLRELRTVLASAPGKEGL